MDTTKLSPTVEEPNYSFIDDDELQKDFMSGANLSQTNIPSKVYFYLYSIITANETPYLKVFLSGGEAAAGEALDFLSADITPGDVLGGGDGAAPLDLNEAFLNECMEKLTTDTLKDHELAANYKEHYKGFVFHDDKVVIVFQLPGTTAAGAAATLTSGLIDEIVNKKQINGAPVHENVRKFLYDNLKCLYITSEDFENYEIPQVFYGSGAAALTRTTSEFGFFYKLSPVPTETMTKKYVCFVENGLFCASGQQPTPDNINKEFDASIIIDPSTEGLWHFKSFGLIFEYI